MSVFVLNMAIRTPKIEYTPAILSEISSEEDNVHKYYDKSSESDSASGTSYAAAPPQKKIIWINLTSWTKV